MFKTAKLQLFHRCYQPNVTLPNLTFGFGSYYYWRLCILAGTSLAVLKFGVYGATNILE